MATNRQRIEAAMLEASLDPEKDRVDTLPGWERRNPPRRIRPGERAVFKTKIWRPAAKKKGDEGAEDRLVLVNAAFFLYEQTEEDK